MKRLTILIISRSFENNILKGFDHLTKKLAKLMDVVLWHQPGDIKDILQALPVKPDLIMLHEHGEKGPVIKGLSTVTIPTVAFLHDLHYKTKDIKNAILKDKIDYIFTIARDPFYNRFPEFIPIMYWCPNHVNPKIFKDLDLRRDIDFLMMGSTLKEVYPLRNKILDAFRDNKRFVFHPHYGYNLDQIKQPFFMGKEYAYEINRAKIFFTCDSIYQYPVQKYYEVLACKTLLLAPSSQELIDLGFIPGVHYVEINHKNFEKRANYYLNNEQERLRIAEQGYNMVHANHTTAIRASQLLDILQKIQRTK